MPQLTLLCLPCAGGSATMYLPWRHRLPRWVTVEPVELPGRGFRQDEPPVTSFDALVELLCDELARKVPARYAIFGHSMGGLLAHGLAHGLHARELPRPTALLVSACASPAMSEKDRFRHPNEREALIDDLRRFGGTPDEVLANPELLSMMLDILSADYHVCESFRDPGLPASPTPVCAFAGRADDISAQSIDDWADTTTAGFGSEWFDGGHFYWRDREDDFFAALTRRLTEMNQPADEP